VQFLENILHSPAPDVPAAVRDLARQELDSAKDRTAPWIENLKEILVSLHPNWHIRTHAAQEVVLHSLLRTEDGEIDSLILSNANLVTQVGAVMYLLGLGSVDKTRSYSLHETKQVKSAATAYIQTRLQTMVKLLVAAIESAPTETTWDHDWLMGWRLQPLRHQAISALTFCAMDGADMREALPRIRSWSNDDSTWNHKVRWLLRHCKNI
jgi:hypothetical protein